jgi:malonyl-CoA decarboxylase
MTNTTEWITRSVSRLRSGAPSTDKAPKASKPAADKPLADKQVADGAATKVPAPRSTHERLQATLRRGNESLSPRALRRLLADLQDVVAPQVSELEGGRRAQVVAGWYGQAEPEERRDMWLLLCEQFAPDATRFQSARQRYEAAAGTADEGQAEISLRRALVSPRTRLMQRFAVFPEGMRFLVDLRAELLPQLKSDKRLVALDADLEHLFTTWFDVAFLELRRLSWDSPASLIEKLIKYEAVHDIRSWADLKNRLDSDRRCYGFFHPRLPNEPLIFVEVALVDRISQQHHAAAGRGGGTCRSEKGHDRHLLFDQQHAAGAARRELWRFAHQACGGNAHSRVSAPAHFCHAVAHSGLSRWLGKNAGAMLERLDDKRRTELGRAVGAEPPQARTACCRRQGAGAGRALARAPDAAGMRRLLSGARAARWQARGRRGALSPGQRRAGGALNWAGDPSAKGMKQSYGLMVNYLYDLKRIDKHRNLLAQGKVPVSGDIDSLCRGG